MKFFIPFIIAYLGSRIIFKYFEFNYDPFVDPFDTVKLLIDVGVFFILFMLGIGVYNYYFQNKKNQD